MPDLDDIFEDIFDGVKKLWRNQQKSKKKKSQKSQKSSNKKSSQPEWGNSNTKGPPHPAERQAQHQPTPSQPVDRPASKGIQSALLRNYLRQAEGYESGILTLMRNAPTEFNRARLEDLTRYIDHWRVSLQALVERVDRFQQNKLLQQDLKDVPKAIQRIEGQLEEGVPQRVEDELRRTLANRQQQLSSLKSLEETMQWAEVKIENTVSMLGTLYSQSTMSQSKGQMGNYQRLLAEIEEESLSLDDYVTTLREIKFGEP